MHKGSTSDVISLSTDGRCCLHPGVRFHFYTTHTPCGDASIFPKSTTVPHTTSVPDVTTEQVNTTTLDTGSSAKRGLELDDIRDCVLYKKPRQLPERSLDVNTCEARSRGERSRERSRDSDSGDSKDSVHVCDGEIDRTGAKCVEGKIQDPPGDRKNYHTLGALCTKPGESFFHGKLFNKHGKLS